MHGFDCSGFVQFILQSVGADPKYDQSSQALHDELLKAGGTLISSAKVGAIAFYGKSNKAITHVAFCLNEHQIIEAGGGDSTCTTLEAAIKKDACVRIMPVNRRKDLVAIVMPKYEGWVNG